MRKIKVSIERLNDLFEKVKNKKFRQAKKRWWKVEEDGSIKAQSIMWLFCWACNGDATDWKAMSSCRDTFNEIFDFNFFQFLGRIGYRFSEHYRYAPSDCERELEELLGKKCPKCQSENVFNLSYGSETSEEYCEEITGFGTADPLLVNPFNCKWRCKDCNNQF